MIASMLHESIRPINLHRRASFGVFHLSVGNRGDGVRVMLCCVFSLSVLVMWSGGVVVVDGNVRISCGRGGRLYVRSHIRVHDWGQGVSMGMCEPVEGEVGDCMQGLISGFMIGVFFKVL